MVDIRNLLLCITATPMMRQDADRCIRRREALCALRYLLAEDGLSECVCVCVYVFVCLFAFLSVCVSKKASPPISAGFQPDCEVRGELSVVQSSVM